MHVSRRFTTRLLLAGGLLLAGLVPAAPAQNPSSAAAVKQIFTKYCLECHGGKRVSSGVKILDRDLLVKKKKVVPGKPGDSSLVDRISDKSGGGMPPDGRPLLTDAEVAAVRRWIADGAPAFTVADAGGAAGGAAASLPPPDNKVKGPLGVEYILRSILNDVRRVPADQRRFVRYFSLVNVLNAGTTREELDDYRDALAKAVNSLSWKPNLVRPEPVEPTRTIYRVNIHDLGWDVQPYRKVVGGRAGAASPLNLFDLVLLEYPYGTIYERTDAYSALLREFLVPAGQVRPVPYVRADWFVSTATLPPLYHDLLQLPQTLPELEKFLGVDADADVRTFRAVRGGLIQSGVSHNNRAVERHATRFGAYWKSFDFKTSAAQENLLADPISLHPTGGEMIFNLPNGLQAYLIVNAKGQRLDAAPTEIVTDRISRDQTVRNGLSCMRCHDGGMKDVKDDVRPTVLGLPNNAGFDRRQVLQLYPSQERMDRLLAADTARFQAAVTRALGHAQKTEPLTTVSKHFLYEQVTLAEGSAELGLAEPKGLKEIFRLPQFVNEGLAPFTADKPVPRDAWEDYYDRVVTQLHLGTPMVPLDGVTRGSYQATGTPFGLEVKTKKGGTTFSPGEELVLLIKATRDVNVELIGTGSLGHKSILGRATTRLKAGEEFSKKVRLPSVAGPVEVTVLASEAPFPTGQLLRGAGVSDRVVHAAPVRANGKRAEVQLAPDPARTVKKTITVTVQ